MLSGRIYQAAVISGDINDHVGSQFAAITQLQAAFLCGFDLDPAAQLDVCPNNELRGADIEVIARHRGGRSEAASSLP